MTDSCIYLDTYVLQQDMRVRMPKAILSNMGVVPGNILDKTTPRLIQFHTLKNAANPPFLGVFSIFGTVAA